MKRHEMKGLCATVVVGAFALAAFGQGVAFEPALTGEVVVAGKESSRLEKRIARDLPIRKDMTGVKSFNFDMCVSNPADFASYVCYFKSGAGWYKVSLELPEDAVPGGWYPMTITTKDSAETEGKPAGWRNVEAVRIAGYRASTNAVSITLRNIGFDMSKPEAYVVQCKAGPRDDGSRYASIFAQALEKIGVEVRQISEADVVPGLFDGAAFVVLPFNSQMRKEACDVVVAFVKKGGKLFACYGQQPEIMDLVGVERKGVYRPSDRGESNLLGFAKAAAGLPGQPDFLAQASWMCCVVKPLAGAQVAAFWRAEDGRTTDIPGLVFSHNGAYLSHVWLNPGSTESSAFLAATVDRLKPGVRARFETSLAAARAEEERMLAATRAMPSRAGERRLIWCHSAWGLGGTNDWDSTCRFLRKNGFTDLVVNLAWGGYAFYPSKVLPQAEAERGDALEQCRAACRKYGIKMHVWKVCWKMGRAVSPVFVQAAKEAGRIQRTRGGELNDDLWNCPSDPYCQRLEIDAMVELALEKKVDGIHFDYIRYPGSSCCFCDGCRKRFEAKLGRPVANWPKDTQNDETVASAWAAFRRDNITRVVENVHARVRAAKSKVEISAAVFRDPIRDPEVVGQDWIRWCAEGWLDFVCPMDYMKSPRRYAERIALQHAALQKAGSKAKFYPGMAIMCSHFERSLTPFVVAQEIAAVRAEGLDGFTLFALSRTAEKVLPVLREGPLADD